MWPVVARIGYSVILLIAAVAAVSEILRIWARKQPVALEFQGTKPDGADGTAFARQLVQEHRLFRAMLAGETAPSGESAIASSGYGQEYAELFRLPRWAALGSDRSVLGDEFQIVFKGINLGNIIRALRKSVRPPDSITGQIYGSEKEFEAFATWERRNALGVITSEESFHTAGATSRQDASANLACQLIWSQLLLGAKEDETRASALEAINRQDFCAWAKARRKYERLPRTIRGGLDPEQENVKKLHADLVEIVKSRIRLPYAYQLFVRLVRSYPEADRRKHRKDLMYAYASYAALVTAKDLPKETNVVEAGIPSGSAGKISAAGIGVALASKGGGLTFATATALVTRHDQLFLIVPEYFVSGVESGTAVHRADFGTSAIYEQISTVGESFADAGVALLVVSQPDRFMNSTSSGRRLSKMSPVSVGDKVTLLSSISGEASGTVSATDFVLGSQQQKLIQVDRHISRPGDGGAPVINGAGELVAMAHSGKDNNSFFLALNSVFAHLDLELAQQ